jgi:ammonia channel protein AmtB
MQVAFSAYAITGALLIVGWFCMNASWQLSVVASLATVTGLLLLAARLGAFRWNAADLILMSRRPRTSNQSSSSD